jgi:uncharacterized protein (UPF0276 family)
MPLQLACNYSRPLLSLLQRGAADVDWIKLSDPQGLEADLAVARPLRPVLMHILGRAGRRPEEWDVYPWEALSRQLTTAGSPHIALHLDLWAEDWEEAGGWQRESRAQSLAVLQRLADGIHAAQRHLQVPILVENMPYYGPGSWRPRITIDPEALWQLVEETGVGVLLDVAHLRCTAYTLGVDVRAYTRALPLQVVRELHVGGPRMVAEDGLLHDRHQELAAEDWALLEWVLGEVSPGIVTLEYGGTGPAFEGTERNDPEALERQLARLRLMVGRGA